MRHPVFPKDSTFGPFPSPGTSATVIVWDDTRAAIGRPSAPPSDSHVRVAFLFYQIVTFIVKWAPAQDAPDSALKIVNGPVVGSVHTGIASVANTYFSADVLLQPGRNQISVVSTTAPSANGGIAVERIGFDGLIS